MENTENKVIQVLNAQLEAAKLGEVTAVVVIAQTSEGGHVFSHAAASESTYNIVGMIGALGIMRVKLRRAAMTMLDTAEQYLREAEIKAANKKNRGH
jgi:hypothetical protein